ncbi:DUF4160 domain-containing protein [Methylomarinovum tepidoasis]|uniref:DUF4160 domain-containing protein n=1 Tax=Methylomarinovum tepidoasis TaxID=2840183 RepID=UPI0025722170|nr:DUF4160 domain-containing protein [Methylomarinovum sp. IN45]
MPEISRFYGIVIKMYFRDHPPPHFHAVYGDRHGLITIDTLEMMEGNLPSRAVRLIAEWGRMHRMALKRMWERQTFEKLPPLP